jgi:hypothetical protein
MAARDDAEVLAASSGVEGLAPIGIEVVAPVFIWRERGGKRCAEVGVATLARCSNACAKLMADCKSSERCISTSEVIGSPRPAVNKFMA